MLSFLFPFVFRGSNPSRKGTLPPEAKVLTTGPQWHLVYTSRVGAGLSILSPLFILFAVCTVLIQILFAQNEKKIFLLWRKLKQNCVKWAEYANISRVNIHDACGVVCSCQIENCTHWLIEWLCKNKHNFFLLTLCYPWGGGRVVLSFRNWRGCPGQQYTKQVPGTLPAQCPQAITHTIKHLWPKKLILQRTPLRASTLYCIYFLLLLFLNRKSIVLLCFSTWWKIFFLLPNLN